MVNITYLIVIFALLSIIPALCVGVACWMRIEGIRSDARDAVATTTQCASQLRTVDSRTAVSDKQLYANTTDICVVKSRIDSLDESLRTVNNKLSSRERTERKTERQNQQPVELPVDTSEFDHEQLSQLFTNSPPSSPTNRKRFPGAVPGI